MTTTLRIYRVKLKCPYRRRGSGHQRCPKSVFLHFEESTLNLYHSAHPEAVLGTVACTHHMEPVVFEYRAADLHRAEFFETRETKGRLLDFADLCVPRAPAPDIMPAGPHLSPRQEQVVVRVVRAEQDKRIAGALGISESMVRKHIAEAAGRIRAEAPDLPLMSPRRTVLAYHARESGPRLMVA